MAKFRHRFENLLQQARISLGETSSHIPLNHHGVPNHQKNRYEKAQERKAETRFFKCFDFETNGRIVKGNKVRHVELNENMTIKIDNNQCTKPAIMASTTTDNKVTTVKEKSQSTTKQSNLYRNVQKLFKKKPNNPQHKLTPMSKTNQTHVATTMTAQLIKTDLRTNTQISTNTTRPANLKSTSSITITKRILTNDPECPIPSAICIPTL